jgi:hypothetical protein
MPKLKASHNSKPKLVPVKVPWRVCFSTSFLRLAVGEDPGDCPTEVTFVAFDLTQEDHTEPAPWEIDPNIHPSSEERIAFANAHSDPRDKVVKITFELSGCARMVPGDIALDPSDFDCSQIPFWVDPALEPEPSEEIRIAEELWSKTGICPDPDIYKAHQLFGAEEMKLAKEFWLRTGICPDPYMYEVHDSPWLQELQSKRLYLGRKGLVFKHYLIQGHDTQVEKIASGWRWEFI